MQAYSLQYSEFTKYKENSEPTFLDILMLKILTLQSRLKQQEYEAATSLSHSSSGSENALTGLASLSFRACRDLGRRTSGSSLDV